jgi:hypothetical protein
MQQAQRRLFISGLPDDVTKAQIVQRFESFMEGKDAQVELKLNPTNNERFAFISLSLSDENLVKCRNLYKKAKWKGKLMRYFELCPNSLELKKPNQIISRRLQRNGKRVKVWKRQLLSIMRKRSASRRKTWFS